MQEPRGEKKYLEEIIGGIETLHAQIDNVYKNQQDFVESIQGVLIDAAHFNNMEDSVLNILVTSIVLSWHDLDGNNAVRGRAEELLSSLKKSLRQLKA